MYHDCALSCCLVVGSYRIDPRFKSLVVVACRMKINLTQFIDVRSNRTITTSGWADRGIPVLLKMYLRDEVDISTADLKTEI